MSSDQFVRNLMGEQRRRAVASLMSYIEKEVYPHLDDRGRRDLRSRVLGSITQYHDTALDVLKASVTDGSMVNQDALAILARMEGRLNAVLREEARS